MTSFPQTELYLIRHGIAAERGTYLNDGDRPLTEKGRIRTIQMAQRLQELGWQVDTLISSPLVHAQQTAEILVAEGRASAYETMALLAPAGSLQTWLGWLALWQKQHPQGKLALVGHEPDLSQWAQQLVQGATHDRWVLKKAGIIGVIVPEARRAIAQSELFWLVPPRLFL